MHFYWADIFFRCSEGGSGCVGGGGEGGRELEGLTLCDVTWKSPNQNRVRDTHLRVMINSR